jgi:hypothetical protein
VITLAIPNPPVVNAARLDADLKAALPVFVGLSLGGSSGLRLHFTDAVTDADKTQAQSIVAAHDAAQLTPEQQAVLDVAATTADAVQRVRDIPQWALISEADALAWIAANLNAPIPTGRTALANADTLAKVKPIVAGMLDVMEQQNATIEKLVRMTLALRDAQWPGLANE